MAKPKACLINWTQDPIETMCYARRVQHSPVPDSLEEFKENPEKYLGRSVDEFMNEILLKDGMPVFQEYVQMTWKLEGVSRALQQQLTRHRIGFSYSIQSMRCVDLPNFAINEDYHNPISKEENPEEHKKYHEKMLKIQDEYRAALDAGVNTQDARGLLPLNVCSTITFSCSLRAFIGMINKRLCLKTQGEFREVAMLMMKEIKEKVDPRILKWIGPPCVVQGYCMMKGECEEQLRLGKLEGKQNTDHVCELYMKLFVDKKELLQDRNKNSENENDQQMITKNNLDDDI